jgi:glycosyltransferase involved in cell wall biosynthesis
LTGLIFVGMVGPDSHNQEERRFVEELSSKFTASYYLRGVGIKGLRPHQLKSIPRRLRRGLLGEPLTKLREGSLFLIPLRHTTREFNTRWIRRQLNDLMRRTQAEWTLWIRFPSPELVDAINQIPEVRVIYEPIDLYSAAEDLSAAHRKRLLAAEARLIKRATVVTGGKQLAERFQRAECESHWLPFGRDERQMAIGVGLPDEIPRPRLGLVGCLDWRVDELLLVSLMTTHPDWQLILAGPRVRPWGQRLKRLTNVHWLGRIPVNRVRLVIRGCDVTLIPYRLTDWTSHCLPVKVFEYLAEGKPVVATPLPELALLRDVVTFAPADSFGDAVEAALDDTSAPAQERRRQAVDRFTLQDRARRAVELVHGKELQAAIH